MKDKLKAKIKLPHIDEADFPYKFYKCYWKDIISSENWEDLFTIKKSKRISLIIIFLLEILKIERILRYIL